MTPSEYAKNAVAALQRVLHISPSEFNANGAATVIEQAIRNATGERDTRVHRELREVQAVAQERLARLLSASPAVIYSFEGTGKYAPSLSATISPTYSAMRRLSTLRTRPSGATESTPTT